MDKYLRNNNVVRAVALVIGILLWVVVHLDIETSIDSSSGTAWNPTISNVMVQAIYDETQYSIVSISPSEVTVSLKGDDGKIRDLNPGNFKIVADLSDLGAGTYELPLAAESPLPKGVTVEIVPSKVTVVMEEKKMKEIPVEIEVTGKPAEGYRAGAASVNPSRVYISGAASTIDEAVTAKATVDVAGATQNVVKKVKLEAYDSSGNVVKGAISPPVLEAEVPITLPLKSLPLQITWIGQPAEGYAVASVLQSVDHITVYGTEAALDKLEYYDGVEIDLTGLTEDKVFSIEIPLKNDAIQIDPPKLEVKVEIEPSVTRTLEGIPVTLSDANANVESRLISPPSGTIDITLEGAAEAIGELSAQDIQALVNVSNLSVGTHELPVSVSVPQFIKRVDTSRSATVEIAAKVKTESASPSATPTAPASAPTVEPTVSMPPESPEATPEPSEPVHSTEALSP